MKKLITVALVIAFASFANASELWWTLSNSPDYGDVSGEWTQIAVYATTGGSYGYNYGGTQIGSVYTRTTIENLDYVATELGEYGTSAYSFYIELQNNSGQRLGASYVGATTGSDGYASSAVASALYGGGMSTAEPSPYTYGKFTTAQVVPEPTSGLLLLLGFAGLALRRKRA